MTVMLHRAVLCCAVCQVQGKDRDRVAAVAKALDLSDYIPRSYIEQVQRDNHTTTHGPCCACRNKHHFVLGKL